MTREELEYGMCACSCLYKDGKTYYEENALIECLEDIGLLKEPCEDAVSRQSVKEGMIKYGFHAPDMTVTEFVEDELPSVTPTRKKGKWIEEPNCWLRCSCCNSHYPHTSINGVKGSNYCPNCGADMKEV